LNAPPSRHVKDFLHEWETLTWSGLLHWEKVRTHRLLPASVDWMRFNAIPYRVEIFLHAHRENQKLVAAKDGVLGDARRLQQREHLRPHCGMIFVVRSPSAGFQSQEESNSLQSGTPEQLSPVNHQAESDIALTGVPRQGELLHDRVEIDWAKEAGREQRRIGLVRLHIGKGDSSCTCLFVANQSVDPRVRHLNREFV